MFMGIPLPNGEGGALAINDCQHIKASNQNVPENTR